MLLLALGNLLYVPLHQQVVHENRALGCFNAGNLPLLWPRRLQRAKVGGKGHTRRILNLGHPLIAPPFPQKHPRRRRMRQHMSAYRLSPVRAGEKGARAWVGLDLIRLQDTFQQNSDRILLSDKGGKGSGRTDHQDADVEFLCHVRQAGQELA